MKNYAWGRRFRQNPPNWRIFAESQKVMFLNSKSALFGFEALLVRVFCCFLKKIVSLVFFKKQQNTRTSKASKSKMHF